MYLPKGHKVYSVYVSMKPVQNVFAKDAKDAIAKVKKRFPNNRILLVREN